MLTHSSMASLPSRYSSGLQNILVPPACSALSSLSARTSGLPTYEYSLISVRQIVPEECQRIREADCLWQGGGDNLQVWLHRPLAQWDMEDV